MATPSEQENAVRQYLTYLDDPSKLVDHEELARLEQQARSATDMLERVKALSQLGRARKTDGEGYKLGFLIHAKDWAIANDVTAEAFGQLGVSDDVLRAAGLLPGRGARSNGEPKGPREPRHTPRAGSVKSEDIRAHVVGRTDAFTLVHVMQAVGGSPMTVRKVVSELVESGEVRNTGADGSWPGPGRAPNVYRVARSG
jgi:hypothetical protein